MTEQATQPLPASSVSLYLDVNMTDHFSYEVPNELSEWTWIEEQARWAHVGNGEEGGVWEFMVLASKFDDDRESIPTSLLPFFEQAREHKCTWVLFHQI